jgi:hypothetical protein
MTKARSMKPKQPTSVQAPLPIGERVDIVGKMVVRSRVFYELWWFKVGIETRGPILGSLNNYQSFFNFDEHAHFVSMIIYLHNVFDERNDVISLPKLLDEIAKLVKHNSADIAEARDVQKRAAPTARKLKALRDDAIAHRSKNTDYKKVFEAAAITADGLRDLTEDALAISNAIRRSLGKRRQSFDELPLYDAKRLMSALGSKLPDFGTPPLEEIFRR